MQEDATSVAIHKLRYLDGMSWCPLPNWARFFLLLGSTLASTTVKDSRFIAAVSTPTRSYAAALIATGIMMRRFQNPVDDASDSHLAYLKSLPEGTTVTYRTGKAGGKMVKGWLVGCVIQNGVEYIKIRDSQTTTYLTPAHRALFVQPAENTLDTLPASIRHRSVNPVGGLARFVPTSEAISRFVQHNRLDCIIVGIKSVLHDEIVVTRFAIGRNQDKLIEGNLQDILGVQEFGRESDIHRSRIIASGSRSAAAHLTLNPSFVVFDGARGFLRWSRVWPHANWIFVGDRTGRRFDEAASVMDEHYVQRILDIEDNALPPPIAGIENVMFRVRLSP